MLINVRVDTYGKSKKYGPNVYAVNSNDTELLLRNGWTMVKEGEYSSSYVRPPEGRVKNRNLFILEIPEQDVILEHALELHEKHEEFRGEFQGWPVFYRPESIIAAHQVMRAGASGIEHVIEPESTLPAHFQIGKWHWHCEIWLKDTPDVRWSIPSIPLSGVEIDSDVVFHHKYEDQSYGIVTPAECHTHPIIKRTPKLVFVDHRCHGEESRCLSDTTVRLDRERLEGGESLSDPNNQYHGGRFQAYRCCPENVYDNPPAWASRGRGWRELSQVPAGISHQGVSSDKIKAGELLH